MNVNSIGSERLNKVRYKKKFACQNFSLSKRLIVSLHKEVRRSNTIKPTVANNTDLSSSFSYRIVKLGLEEYANPILVQRIAFLEKTWLDIDSILYEMKRYI